jgi:hypothetical protein
VKGYAFFSSLPRVNLGSIFDKYGALPLGSLLRGVQ